MTDTTGCFKCNQVDLDPQCSCLCQKCNCNVKKIEGGGSANCDPMTFSSLMKLPDLTEEEIKQAQLKRAQFNSGLYYRSRALAKSRESNVVTKTPCHFLHPFWDAKMIYPQRQVVSMTLTLKPDSCILVIPTGKKGQDYKLTVESMYLDLKYAVFLDPLRDRWLQSINALNLQRSVIGNRSVHFLMKGGASNARFASVFSFSVTCKTLVFCFTPESVHQGDYLNNRHYYHHYFLSSLKIHVGGVPLISNSIHSTLNLKKKYGEDHFYFYENMLQTFGKEAIFLTPESMYRDCFIFCVPIQGYYYGNDFAMAREIKERKLNFLSVGGIDMDLSFAEPLPHNVMVNVIGIYDLLLKFGVDGSEVVN